MKEALKVQMLSAWLAYMPHAWCIGRIQKWKPSHPVLNHCISQKCMYIYCIQNHLHHIMCESVWHDLMSFDPLWFGVNISRSFTFMLLKNTYIALLELNCCLNDTNNKLFLRPPNIIFPMVMFSGKTHAETLFKLSC